MMSFDEQFPENDVHAECAYEIHKLERDVERLREANEDAEKEIATLMDGMELAWCLIANAEQDSWDRHEGDWYGAATRFRDKHWHPALDRNPRVKSELAEAVDKVLEGK